MARTMLKSKIKKRLSQSKETVFAPKDFLHLAGRDQAGRVLRQLITEESLLRIGHGLYAKARKSPLGGNVIPEKALPELAKEALNKLGVTVVPSTAERAYNSGKTTQVPTGRVIGVKGRVSRRIGYGGKFVTYERLP